MESYRLKNIILLILALTNLFLLATLLSRRADEARLLHASAEQVSQLFARQDIALDPDLIPSGRPSEVLNLARNTKEEGRLAAFFLGRDTDVTDEGGGLTRYESSQGSLVFRSSGDFDLTASLETPEPEDFCAGFFRRFGYREESAELDGGTGTVTALQYFSGIPVVNCTVTFTFSNGTLSSVIGRHLPEKNAAAAAADCITAFTAMTAFLSARSEARLDCSTVTEVELGYALQNTPAAPLSLVPVWRITTDAFQCYVNSMTGEVVWL